jgi:hypothetical protein
MRVAVFALPARVETAAAIRQEHGTRIGADWMDSSGSRRILFQIRILSKRDRSDDRGVSPVLFPMRHRDQLDENGGSPWSEVRRRLIEWIGRGIARAGLNGFVLSASVRRIR